MKQIQVKKINLPKISDSTVIEAFEKNEIEYHTLDYANWDEFPYLPDVQVAIAHTGDKIVFHWIVDEQLVRGLITENNGAVSKDSCVEFFFSPDNNDHYYNLEINCIGTVLFGYRKMGMQPTRVTDECIEKIYRKSTLGKKIFDEELTDEPWEMVIVLPTEAIFAHGIKDFSGTKIKANLYKCGDGLSVPHYISWNEMPTPNLNFHLPEFFGELVFV